MAEGEAAVAAFERIVAWVTKHKKAKAILPSLNKPASAQAMAEFEAKTKLKLPESIAAIYRLHDGQDEGAANEKLDPAGEVDSVESGLFPSIEGEDDLPFLLVPLAELAENTTADRFAFRKGWVPFADNYGGDNIVLDLASTEPQRRGRVLAYNHEYGAAVPLAASFEAYLRHIADGLDARKIVWSDESGLSYKRAYDWDELIEAARVEYDPDHVRESGSDYQQRNDKPLLQ
jgi:cell wall assembly regulator SMI1